LISDTPPTPCDRTRAYLNAWTASVCDVLEKIAGAPFIATNLSSQEAAQEAGTLSAEGVWLRFTVAQALKGEQSLGISKTAALRLAQTLMGEPFNASQDFSSEYQDALDELFRQFAGTAALALKARVGGEVNLQLAGHDPGGWNPRVQQGVRLNSEGTGDFLLLILLDPELGEGLASDPSEKAVHPPAVPIPFERPKPAAASKGTRNIDLLLDVELQVALRFGKAEMPLGSILELSAGAVVELDQKILEPVELLVGSKVVAQGEVVVMDGHYALRITEVLNPLERLESLQA